MQAVILAAGMGKRLKELTNDNTKCMIQVNGVTLIERMLHQLEQQHLSRIVIVVGYKGEKLIDYILTLNIQTLIVFINNPIYEKTNNIYSLSLAKDWLCKEDTILLESDLIFEDSILSNLISAPEESLALVDKYEAWMDGTCVKLSEDNQIISFINKDRFKYDEIGSYYKTVNIYKFSKHFSETYYVPFLEAYQAALGQNEYYEQVLRVITMLDSPEIKAKKLTGQKWYEIDDIQDLDIAQSIFTPNEDAKVSLLQERFGGYWRYPHMLDYSYLVNPYYPPQKMKDEIKASFDTLLTEYPSGMKVNTLLASKNFDVHQKNIVVGNGASELIKSLLGFLEGKTGIICPTFDEYPNRYSKEIIRFLPDNDNLSYDEKDLIEFFRDKGIQNLFIINPDNPSGNYIKRSGILKIIEWASEKKINVLIDESFVDFSSENSTLFNQDILDRNPHLYVMKSISKSFGVPGLRLGVLASGNREMLERIKKDIPIWNINSFAEFYLQIAEKYQKEYVKAMEIFRLERNRFYNELRQIKEIRPIPSEANYIMVEIEKDVPSSALLKRLLTRHQILIKDLSGKVSGKNFIRIAIRDTHDNDILLNALKQEITNYKCGL